MTFPMRAFTAESISGRTRLQALTWAGLWALLFISTTYAGCMMMTMMNGGA
jgi:hypothetical protein